MDDWLETLPTVKTHREMLLIDKKTIAKVGKMEPNNDDSTRDKYRTQLAQMSVDEIINLTTDVFSLYINHERLRLFADIRMYLRYLFVVLYSSRAAQIIILHHKDVDRLNFITTVARMTAYYILQEYSCKDCSYSGPWSLILQS